MPDEPKPPAELGAEGRKLWRQIVRDAAGQGVELDARELVWLREAAKLADRIALMDSALDGEPLVVPGYMNKGMVAHPLLNEIRLHSQLLSLTLARNCVDVPEASGGLTVAPANRHRSAALTRWYGKGSGA